MSEKIKHRALPGPMYWDWRCLVCGYPVNEHPNRFSLWWNENKLRPFPPGVLTLFFIAPVTFFFLIVSYTERDPLFGVLALAFGVWCIFCVSGSSYHAGMRKVADAHRSSQ